MLRYKNIRMNAMFSYSLGAKTRLFRMFNKNLSPEYNVHRDFLKRWQNPGDELNKYSRFGILVQQCLLELREPLLGCLRQHSNFCRRRLDHVRLFGCTSGKCQLSEMLQFKFHVRIRKGLVVENRLLPPLPLVVRDKPIYTVFQETKRTDSDSRRFQ